MEGGKVYRFKGLGVCKQKCLYGVPLRASEGYAYMSMYMNYETHKHVNIHIYVSIIVYLCSDI